MGAIRIGRWDCRQCGHQANLGPLTHCKQCGSPRPQDVQFYLPDDAPEVTNLDEIKRAKAGADWTCSYCSSGNAATNTLCYACGNDRAEGEDKQRAVKEYDLASTPRQGSAQQKSKPQPQAAAQRNAPPTSPPLTPAQRRKRVIWGAVLALLLWWVYDWYSHRPQFDDVPWKGAMHSSSMQQGRARQLVSNMAAVQLDDQITIDELQWHTHIAYEKLIPVQHEGDYVPSGSRQLSSRQVIDHYKDVPDGYETKTRNVRVATGTREYKCGTRDLGNGYFEDKMCTETIYENRTESYQEQKYRKEPVYKTRYTYETDEWHPSHTTHRHGANRQPQYASSEAHSKLREQKRYTDYTAHFRYRGRPCSDLISQKTWQALQPGQLLTVKRGLLAPHPTELDRYVQAAP